VADLLDLLEKTSRTFALSIPPLPEPTRKEVTVAYLLFRIADTFEDAAHHPPQERVRALGDLAALLRSPSPAEAARLAKEWSTAGWALHAGYAELLGKIPFVLEAFSALSPSAIEAIRGPVALSVDGMASFVSRTQDGRLALSSLADLRSYCHVVAGLVGEMLTELFLLGRPNLTPVAPDLRKRAALFGEALQLVNILKDAAGDAAEGRTYVPPGVPLDELFALARRDLAVAGEYIEALERAGAPRGILEFTALPVELAWATLDRVERVGSGAKVSRAEVFLLVRRVRDALDSGGSVGTPHRRH
jgi:farnesyl-diphosphate farnesyltransferase